MTPRQVKLNRLAQGLESFDSGLKWFESSPSSEQKQILRDLGLFAHQAHPTSAEVPIAILHAGLKPTHTPCVLARSTTSPDQSFSRILKLPESEWTKSFRLLLALLAVADRRRRETTCKDGCTHSWHNLESNAT